MVRMRTGTTSMRMNLAGAAWILSCAAVASPAVTVSAVESPVVLQAYEPLPVVAMNEDQFQGKWKQFKGELKRRWAKFTDDDLLYIEGSLDKLDGKIQERYGDRKEEVKQWVDEWFEQRKSEKTE